MQASGPWPPVRSRSASSTSTCCVVERLAPCLRRSASARRSGKAVDGDDPLGAQQKRALDRELADRPAAPDRDRVARLDLAVLRGHVAGREDVGEEQHLLVGQRVGHLERPDVGERHAHVLRLPAGIAAVHVRVAEQARARIAARASRPSRRSGSSCRRATRAVPCRSSSGRTRS